ncbi:hypothetical protein F8O01_05845 [Pseudoclavibacter chungangensis]|uniref:Uncharacterized protein n=1 Tax=Pseudoclavibacter chungangensis TaxID=587635 RepID=A0A7J5BYM6_9MICO|nr:hypothetical protein [Pseudoclavibacter chungangensis]KAB1659449.1 hypothetical protein F8O01_05845 [Pseudoclavibacter chungangensis]NYJ67698.1 hypothetical protein [Pseudoclavibacter chungangensis]
MTAQASPRQNAVSWSARRVGGSRRHELRPQRTIGVHLARALAWCGRQASWIGREPAEFAAYASTPVPWDDAPDPAATRTATDATSAH